MVSIPNLPDSCPNLRLAAPHEQRTSLAPLPFDYSPKVTSSNARQLVNPPTWMAFSSALPLLLWAEQESSPDTGGTWVFLVCCALVLFIFSKTGWRNEAPK